MKQLFITFVAVLLVSFGVVSVGYGAGLFRPNSPGGLFSPLDLSSLNVFATSYTAIGPATSSLSSATDTPSYFLSRVSVGTTTQAANVFVMGTNSTTVQIGNGSTTACLVMGNSSGTGVSYITVLGGTLTATTTKPSICF